MNPVFSVGPEWQYKTSAFTAEKNGMYVCNGTFSITNPTGAAGDTYFVIVAAGAVTMNSFTLAAGRLYLNYCSGPELWSVSTDIGSAFIANLSVSGTTSLDGNLTFGASANTAWSARQALAGDVADARYPRRLFARRTSTSDRTSTTTVSDDTQLILAVSANKTYLVTANLSFATGTTGGVKYQIGVSGQSAGWTIAGYSELVNRSTNATVGIVMPNDPVGAAGASSWLGFVSATVRTNAAGNISLQWAQNVSNATPSVIQTGSSLTVLEME